MNAFRIGLRFVKYRFVNYWFRFVSRSWLDTDISREPFVYLKDLFKTSSIHVFKTSSRHLQRNNISSFKASSRLLQDVLQYENLLRWRLVEDVFKTCLENVIKTSCRPKIFAGIETDGAKVILKIQPLLYH